MVPGLFSVGYFPIANFLKDISLSDKCPPEFLPIMDFYPLCFAHQEKTLPGFIPITILPIYWWIFLHQIFAHHRIAHQTRINQKLKIVAIFYHFYVQILFKGSTSIEAYLFNLTFYKRSHSKGTK